MALCFDVVLHSEGFLGPGALTDHPQDGSGGLLHLMRAAPPGFDRGQTKVSDLHRQAFM